MMEDTDSFEMMFKGAPGANRRRSREVRAQKERRTQFTEKQRRRKAVRTTQINFRCSPAFRDLAKGLSDKLDCSIADVMEEALQMLAQKRGFKGEVHG